MLVLLGITAILATTIIYLLPDGESLTSSEKLKYILIIIFVLALAVISNSLNLVAMSLQKGK